MLFYTPFLRPFAAGLPCQEGHLQARSSGLLGLRGIRARVACLNPSRGYREGVTKGLAPFEALQGGVIFEHISEQQHDAGWMSTDGSRSDAGVGCVGDAEYFTCSSKFPREASIFTAKLCAMELTLGCIKSNFSNRRYEPFVLCSDSAVRDVAEDHLIVCNIFK